jgi:anti-sigma B factor antagonist
MMSAEPSIIDDALTTSDEPRGAAVFAIDHRSVDECTSVVAVEGDLDLSSAPVLKRVLVERLNTGCNHVVIDLRRVRFVDSTALGVLVGIRQRLEPDDRLALAGPPAPVQRTIEVSGLGGAFETFPALDDALAYVGGDGRSESREGPPLSGDVTLMLGIAATAMPFAESIEDEAERWLRLLRRHGKAGMLLASLGVSEARIERPSELEPGAKPATGDSRVIDSVITRACRIAGARQAPKVSTIDVLRGVMDVYGTSFDQVLRAHGGDVAELTSRLLS